ncbi:MAG: hypothetical protein AB1521_11415 [Bacteroidota bacterium]
MEYVLIKTLHILFAGIWMTGLIIDSLLRSAVSLNKHKSGEKKFIRLYLNVTNILGIIGSSGILVSGIILVTNSGYQFFQMDAQHWLTTKQIIMVIMLVIIFSLIIPTAKKIKTALGEDLESNQVISEEGYKNLYKLYKLNTVVNVLVLINFLLAATHWLIG